MAIIYNHHPNEKERHLSDFHNTENDGRRRARKQETYTKQVLNKLITDRSQQTKWTTNKLPCI
jgi:hypothetical protein